MRTTGVLAGLGLSLLLAAPAGAQQLSITDPAGDGANNGLDVVRAAVDNGDDRVVVRVRFVESVRGDLVVSLDQRGGRGVRLVSERDASGDHRDYVVGGAFTDRRPSPDPDCGGFRVRWSDDAPVARMRMPSSCLGDGDYGAVRFAVLTERGGDTDYAPGEPVASSDWIPRG